MEEIDIITPDYIKEFSKSLCKIIIGNKIGSGFFMKSKIKNDFKKKACFLITNCHVISDDMINSKQYIEIDIEYNNEKREIQLDNEQRFIKCFPKPIDITIIEILESDNLKNKIKYLKRDYLDFKEGYKKYLSKNIYIFHHPKGEDAVCSRGKIISIDDYSFTHNAFTNNGSSGSAIILADTFKVIGIHCKKKINNNINTGVFIEEIIDELYAKNLNKIPDKSVDKLISSSNLDSAPSIEIYQIITLRYKKSLMNFIKIFGDIFVRNNINNCKIFVEDKEYKLCGKLNISKMKKIGNEYEIKLKIINDLTDLSYMFHLCSSLSPSSEVNKINISNAKNISYLFSECQYLSQLPDISEWNTGNVENIACLFAGCQSLLSLPDISKWDTSNIKNMMGIFAGCTSLSSIPDISKWNTNNVCKMDYVFFRCDLLKEIPDISKWDTKNVITMSYMFYNCSSLSYLPDISNWNTSNVKYIEFMFANCEKLLSLPNFSSWDARKVQSMQNLFSNLKCVKKPIKFPKTIKRKNKERNNHKTDDYFAHLVV